MRNFISIPFGGKKATKQQESTPPKIQTAEQPVTVNNGGILGAVIGDIAGSRFEFRNVKSKDIELLTDADDFTDDTVMTIAVADWLMSGASLPNMMRDWAAKYPNSDYGGMFYAWLFPLNERKMQPYNSYCNGAGMRVSPCGYMARTLDEALAPRRLLRS